MKRRSKKSIANWNLNVPVLNSSFINLKYFFVIFVLSSSCSFLNNSHAEDFSPKTCDIPIKLEFQFPKDTIVRVGEVKKKGAFTLLAKMTLEIPFSLGGIPLLNETKYKTSIFGNEVQGSNFSFYILTEEGLEANGVIYIFPGWKASSDFIEWGYKSGGMWLNCKFQGKSNPITISTDLVRKVLQGNYVSIPINVQGGEKLYLPPTAVITLGKFPVKNIKIDGPSGTEVFIDDASIGKVPVDLPISFGNYTIQSRTIKFVTEDGSEITGSIDGVMSDGLVSSSSIDIYISDEMINNTLSGGSLAVDIRSNEQVLIGRLNLTSGKRSSKRKVFEE